MESSTFGSDFIAIKQCCEYIRGLRHTLCTMFIPVCGPTHVNSDKQSVLSNTCFPESKLTKKYHSIAYHVVREGVARNNWLAEYVNIEYNPSNTFTDYLYDMS